MAERISSKTNRATLRGLLPDWDYAASVSANGGANWSPTFFFRTISDQTAPATPSNVQVNVQGSSFIVTWTAPTTNEDGSALSDFNDFVVRVYPTGNSAAAIEETTKSTTYEFSIYQNRHFFGTPQGALTFEVISRDLTMNRSAPATVNATASAPVAFTIYINTSVRAIEVYWNNQGVTTFYKVYRDTTQNFVPNDGTNLLGTIVSEAAEETRLSYWDIPPTTGTYYYKVVAVDAFNNTAQSSNEVSGAAQEAGGGLDTTPLNTPAAPTVIGGVHSFTVQHNMLDSTGAALGNNLARFDVYADTAAGFVPGSANFVGSIAVSSAGIAEETFVWVVKSTTTNAGTTVSGTDTVYVKVVAVNLAGGATAASAEASGTVEGAGSPYFKALAIGDGHIDNLSANKLKANTGIVNNLNVSALLKMGAGGVLESGNYTLNTSGVQTAGWRLTDTQFSIVGATRINGTIEATAGWLQNLTVYSNLTVGSSATAGAIQSYNYVAGSTGWKVASAGDAEFNNVTIRGYVDAQSGYLRSLNVIGTLAIGAGGKLSVNADRFRIDQYGLTAFNGSTNTMRIDQYGNATFYGTLSAATGTFKGDITGASGTFSGSLAAGMSISSPTITGGKIQTDGGTGSRVVMDATNRDSIYWYYSGSTGFRISADGSGRIYISTSGGSGDGIIDNKWMMNHVNVLNYAAHINHGHGEYASSGTRTTSGPSTSTSGSAAPSTNQDYFQSNTSGTISAYTFSGSGHTHAIPYHYHTTPNHAHSISHSHSVSI